MVLRILVRNRSFNTNPPHLMNICSIAQKISLCAIFFDPERQISYSTGNIPYQQIAPQMSEVSRILLLVLSGGCFSWVEDLALENSSVNSSFGTSVPPCPYFPGLFLITYLLHLQGFSRTGLERTCFMEWWNSSMFFT